MFKHGCRYSQLCLFPYSPALLVFFLSVVFVLGSSVSVLAEGSGSGRRAIDKLKSVLPDPDGLLANVKKDTEDFVKNHMGSLAVAFAFSTGIRAVSK